ncbi:MAG TPA: ABC transporter permease, partial [Clostridia bacterium]|nr:ABC transporter permease [Clostridia bacterium]
MSVILKFTIRNIKEKKFRTFLILFSIMISSALFFASGAMSGSVAQMLVDRMRSSVGASEIIIHANEKSPSEYMTTSAAEAFREDMDFIASNVFCQGMYKTDSKETFKIDLNGYVFSELQMMNPVALE